MSDDGLLRRLAEMWTARWDGRFQFVARDGYFRHAEDEELQTVVVCSVRPTQVLAFGREPAVVRRPTDSEPVLDHQVQPQAAAGRQLLGAGQTSWSSEALSLHKFEHIWYSSLRASTFAGSVPKCWSRLKSSRVPGLAFSVSQPSPGR